MLSQQLCAFSLIFVLLALQIAFIQVSGAQKMRLLNDYDGLSGFTRPVATSDRQLLADKAQKANTAQKANKANKADKEKQDTKDHMQTASLAYTTQYIERVVDNIIASSEEREGALEEVQEATAVSLANAQAAKPSKNKADLDDGTPGPTTTDDMGGA